MVGGRFRLVDGTSKQDARHSFEEQYRACYPMVYNYVFRRMSSREATEDVVSEAFLRAARFYDRFDERRAKFSTWVISIARNCISDYFSREAPVSPLDEVPEGAYSDEGLHVEQLGDAELVQHLLSSLDETERELVYMKYYEGKRNVEIAEALGMNASTISTKLARALSKMRAIAS